MATIRNESWGFLHAVEERWQPSDQRTVRSDEIHVWRACLPIDRMRLQAFGASLDERERERAGRFRYARDAQRYVAAHGILRSILAPYANLPPHAIAYEYSARGKPALAQPDGRGTIAFNMGHSGDLVLIAIGGQRAVGVDVERVREDVDLQELGSACLTGHEAEILETVPDECRRELLFRWWTRKEAYAKACGAGLGISPKECQITPPFLRVISPDEIVAPARPSEHWALWDVSPLAGYVGAVAAPGGRKAIRFIDYAPWESGHTPPSGVAPVVADERQRSWWRSSYHMGHG